jgi:argininosuccinate lyase
VVGRRSERSLYQPALATYDGAADRFDHRHAEGFVRLWSLPIKTWASAQGDVTRSPAIGETAVERQDEPDRAATGAANGRRPSGSSGAAAASEPLWAGRFGEPPDAETLAFTRSLAFDIRLAPYDVRATQAHAHALHQAGVLAAEDLERIVHALDEIGGEIAGGTFAFDAVDEDIHSAIERALIDRLGPAGARIHAGRSRNDLVVTDLRMWTKDSAAHLAGLTRALVETLAGRAAEHRATIMPGYTHLQQAQPTLLGHHLLAHVFALVRDIERLGQAAASADVSGLGAGALAGSTIALDVAETAARLGFATAFDNSIDAVSDRDFALAFLSACAILGVHLSRLAEDVVLWCTREFGFAVPSDAHATGSSMMPQKRNPDIAELVRGKAGRLLGGFVALATAMKGLPLAYDRDLQEDKEPLFDAFDTLSGALPAFTSLLRDLRFDADRMRDAAGGSILATDLAERLVTRGVPFRDAHRKVGALVAQLEAKGRTLTDVTPGELVIALPEAAEADGVLSAEAAVARLMTAGGTSPASVETQLAAIGARLSRPIGRG